MNADNETQFRWTDERLDQLREMCAQGASTIAMSTAIGASRASILVRIRRHNITRAAPVVPKRVPSTHTASGYQPYVPGPGLPMRSGSQDFLTIPSRMGDMLHHRDGTRVHIDAEGVA